MHSKTIYLWNANYHFDQLLNSEQRVKKYSDDYNFENCLPRIRGKTPKFALFSL